MLTLARPGVQTRRPAWQPLTLGPLETEDIARMLEGLAPGLPEELVAQIARRAEGIPLYAVETIRMLQDRGLLVQEGSRYVVTGEVSDLEVPETLHALVASRLDGLSAAERSLLQDASGSRTRLYGRCRSRAERPDRTGRGWIAGCTGGQADLGP